MKRDLLTKVFLSYAKEDVEIARKLYSQLKSYNIDVWFDEENILGGQEWMNVIKDAIRNCRYFLLLLSSNSVSKKGYLNVEINNALENLDEYPKDKIYIVPVRLDNCSPKHPKINEIQIIDIFPSWERGLYKILQSLEVNKSVNENTSISDIAICRICGASDFIFVKIKYFPLKGWAHKM